MLAHRTLRRPFWVAACISSILMLCTVAPAALASTSGNAGSIDHVEPMNGKVSLLYSIPDLGDDASPDLSSVEVSIDGESVPAEAQLAGESTEKVRRTAILAIDVSNSMRGERFEQAKVAAKVFLDAVPTDVYVGIVAFAGNVQTVQEPSLDRASAAAVLDELTLSQETRLYEGVAMAVEAAGNDGQRTLLVLSDGGDTTQTPLNELTQAIEAKEIKVDVVALAQSPGAVAPLEEMAGAGKGTVHTADNPEALSDAFSAEAVALAKQVLITADVPAERRDSEGSVSVSVVAGGETYTDSAFVTVSGGEATAQPKGTAPGEIAAPRFEITQQTMLIGLGVGGVGVLVVLLLAFGVFDRERTETLEDRIAAYRRTGDARSAAGTPGARLVTPKKPEGIKGSAVEIAEKALAGNKGLAASVADRLEAAGMSLKPAEWLLMHAGIAFGAALVGLLLSSGGILLTMLSLVGGLAIPWLYLGFKRSRRTKSFNDQLADTLQLISGGLSAGLSLAQSVDTVVRQGSEPMAAEFKRALVEARLGVQIEDGLESVSERMQSEDFRWVVMAVRIQREVGGNLAEVLSQVAATIRERAYLRRQVKALSAEGKMSAWILGALPIVILIFLLLTQPAYLAPMIANVLGWLMLGAAAVMMAIGVFWLTKIVKMEV